MDGRTDGRMDGWMDGRKHLCRHVGTCVCSLCRYVNEDGFMDEWIACMCGCVYLSLCPSVCLSVYLSVGMYVWRSM